MRIEAQRFIILVTAGLRRSVYSVGADDVVLCACMFVLLCYVQVRDTHIERE